MFEIITWYILNILKVIIILIPINFTIGVNFSLFSSLLQDLSLCFLLLY